MGGKIRVHPGNSPGHRQFAHLFTRRLLCGHVADASEAIKASGKSNQ
jgi:hypothetical protein